MNTERKNSIRSYSIYLLVVLLAIFQIIASNRLSNYGKKISSLSVQTNRVLELNESLKTEIASSSALLNLTAKAKELGFSEKAEVLYIDQLYSVAQKSF